MKADKLINADNRTVSKLLNHEKYRGFLNPYYQWSLSILKGYTLYDVKDMASRKRKIYWKNRWTTGEQGSQGSESAVVLLMGTSLYLWWRWWSTRDWAPWRLWPWIKLLCQCMFECSLLCVAIMEGFACPWEAVKGQYLCLLFRLAVHMTLIYQENIAQHKSIVLFLICVITAKNMNDSH